MDDATLARTVIEHGLLPAAVLGDVQAGLAPEETLGDALVRRGLLAAGALAALVAGGPGGPAPGLTPGAIVDGTYRVEEAVAQGGMGIVLRARDLRRDLPVALKLLQPGLLSVADVSRFQREGELTARLGDESGVVRVFAAGTHAGVPYCAMEWIEGEDLAAAFRTRGPEEAAARVEQVARIVARCHAAGVVHRDLKPSNVMLRASDGQPVLLDFGLARAVAPSDRSRLTQTGEVLGTPAFMAPEQADPSLGAVGPATDVYALGALLYAGLTGRPPFSGGLLQVLAAVVRDPPPAPTSLRPDVPPEVERVCLRALAKAPADRYATADAFADALAAALRGEPAPRPRLLPWIAAAALLLLALGVCLRSGLRSTAGAPDPTARAAVDRAAQWSLGFAPDAPPPSTTELKAALDALESDASDAGRAGRLQAAAALAALGASDRLASRDGSAAAALGALAREILQGDPRRRALARLERLEVPAPLAPLRARAARAAYGVALRRALSEPERREPDALRSEIADVWAAAVRLGVADPELAATAHVAKRAAVAALLRHADALPDPPSVRAVTQWAQRVGAVLSTAPALEPLPEVAACADRVEASLTRAWAAVSTARSPVDPASLRAARAVTDASDVISLTCAPGHRPSLPVHDVLNGTIGAGAFDASRPIWASLLRVAARAAIDAASEDGFMTALEWLPPEDRRAFRDDGTQATRFCILAIETPWSDGVVWADPSARATFEASARRILDAPVRDLPPRTLGIIYVWLATAGLAATAAHDPEGWPRSLAAARAGLEAYPTGRDAHLLRKLHEAEFRALHWANRDAEATEAWRGAVARFRERCGRAEAGDGGVDSPYEEQRALAELLKASEYLDVPPDEHEAALIELRAVAERLGEDLLIERAHQYIDAFRKDLRPSSPPPPREGDGPPPSAPGEAPRR